MKTTIKQATYWGYFLCFFLLWIVAGTIVSFFITAMILMILNAEPSSNIALIIEAVIIVLFPYILFKKTNWKLYIVNKIERNTLKYIEFKQFKTEKSFKVLTTYSLNYYLVRVLGVLKNVSLVILGFSFYVSILYEVPQTVIFKYAVQTDEFVKTTSLSVLNIMLVIAFFRFLSNVINVGKRFVFRDMFLLISYFILCALIINMNKQGWEKILDISFAISLSVLTLTMFTRMFEKFLGKKIIRQSGFYLSCNLGESENVEHIDSLTVEEFKDVNSVSMSKNIVMDEAYRKYLLLEKFNYEIRKYSVKGVGDFGQIDEFGNKLYEEFTPTMSEVTIDFKIKIFRVPLSITNSYMNEQIFESRFNSVHLEWKNRVGDKNELSKKE